MIKTVSQAIIQWLYGFGDISIDESIDTNQLQAMSSAYGLYKTPQTIINTYVDGSRDVTVYYLFMVRQRSQTEPERKASDAWLEGLELWVRQQAITGNLPDLGPGISCQTVKVANVATMQYQESGDAVYQLSIAINYIDERVKNIG